MTILPLLLAQAASARDTVVMVAARDGLSLAVDLATVVLAAALLLVALAALAGLLALRKGVVDAKRWARGLQADPALRRGRDLVENLEVITSSLRTDVARLSTSIEKLSGRLDHASDRMEERIEDFNALLEVVQEEAEEVFVRTAANVRGVRVTARALGGSRSESSEGPVGDSTPPTAGPEARHPTLTTESP
jgi:hypothetical protein